MCCTKAKSAFDFGARRPYSENLSSASRCAPADHLAEKGGCVVFFPQPSDSQSADMFVLFAQPDYTGDSQNASMIAITANILTNILLSIFSITSKLTASTKDIGKNKRI